jgi:hypothetical protein
MAAQTRLMLEFDAPIPGERHAEFFREMRRAAAAGPEITADDHRNVLHGTTVTMTRRRGGFTPDVDLAIERVLPSYGVHLTHFRVEDTLSSGEVQVRDFDVVAGTRHLMEPAAA